MQRHQDGMPSSRRSGQEEGVRAQQVERCPAAGAFGGAELDVVALAVEHQPGPALGVPVCPLAHYPVVVQFHAVFVAHAIQHDVDLEARRLLR